ncbi:MAG TPA: hypothetical protein P5084_13350 [Paludibacter sp.]|nr:hypothetical protein [Paludibacter sp.]
MNLFWKKLTRGITPTAKIEKEENEIVNALQRYNDVEKSLEIVKYKSLYHEVKSPAFIENKKKLQNRKYKDTEEFRTITQFRKLQNSESLRLYFQVLGSFELKEYETFKLSPRFEDLNDNRKIKESEKLSRLKNFEHSKAYKTYLRYHNSYILKEYMRLKEVVSTPEFKIANDFWSNENRWFTTPQYEVEQRFYELANHPNIVSYLNENPKRFENYKSLKLTFNDEFEWSNFDESQWKYGFHYKSSKLIGNHSFANEKQANNSGQNISVDDSTLQIITKNENQTSIAWHPVKGFIQKNFEYTSDVIQTGDTFKQKEGIFKAKLRCKGNIHHAFWLGADDMLPHINIFHFDGKKIRVGNVSENLTDGIEIKGLDPSEYYIYTLIWKNNELTWKINNVVVYRTTSYIPEEAMYLAFNSFIPEKMIGSSGQLEVDWVRVYQN